MVFARPKSKMYNWSLNPTLDSKRCHHYVKYLCRPKCIIRVKSSVKCVMSFNHIDNAFIHRFQNTFLFKSTCTTSAQCRRLQLLLKIRFHLNACRRLCLNCFIAASIHWGTRPKRQHPARRLVQVASIL